MPVTPLAKPGTITSAVININGNIGADGDTFVIKVQRIRIRHTSPVIETTGDTDTDPVWENNRLIYGQFSLVGFMVSNAAVGILKLRLQDDATGNENGDGLPTITWHYSSGMEVTNTVIIEEIVTEMARNAVAATVAMVGRTTDARPGEIQ